MTKSNDQVRDVIIIGAGVAGLAAAYRLDDLDVVVIEREEIVGGRTKVVDIAGLPAYTGAGVVYHGTATHALVGELGIEIFAAVPQNYAAHACGVTVVARTDGELVAGLPLPQEGRVALRALLRRIRDDYDRYSRDGLTAESDELADISFSEYLGALDPSISTLMRELTFAHCMAWPEELSAKYAIRYLAMKLVADGTHASFIMKGMHQIALALRDRLAAEVIVGATVHRIQAEADMCRVVFASASGEERTLVGHQVVIAVPGPEVNELVALPTDQRAAIDGIESVPGLMMAVILADDDQAAWRDVFYAPVLDRSFDYLCNCRFGPDAPSGPTIWQLGAWGPQALEQMALSDEEITTRWLADLEAVFPGAGDRVLGCYVQRWPAGFAIPKADRRALLDLARASHDGLHFAGDWASESAGTHGAIESGMRAAEQVRARRANVADMRNEVSA